VSVTVAKERTPEANEAISEASSAAEASWARAPVVAAAAARR